MPLDAIAIRAEVKELGEVEGFKIDKIQQPERDVIVLSIRGVGTGRRLLISANSQSPRVTLTEDRPENPAVPPMFCMLLRKNLVGGRITAIRQIAFERIIDIEIEAHTELGDLTSRHLVCELMGRNSNIIFLNEEMKIIDSIKHVDLSQSARGVLPGLRYMPPPDGGRLDPTKALSPDFMRLLTDAEPGQSADKAIASAVGGISPLLARECVFTASGDGNLKIGEMSPNIMQKTAVALEKLFELVKEGSFAPCILLKRDEDGRESVTDFAPFPIYQYGDKLVMRPMDSINTAAEEFYVLRDREARMKSRASSLLKVVNNSLNRATKKLGLLQSDLAASKDREKYRIFGDLLSANLHLVERGAREITVMNFYDENQADIKIPLDETKSPAQNVKNYYNKYKKAKNTELYAGEQIELTRNEIAYLESVQLSLENAATPAEIGDIRAELEDGGYVKGEKANKKKRASVALEPMEFTFKGYTILVGRNNVQNDYLTLKLGRSRDLWLHTKNIAGSHALIKYQDGDFPPEVIETAAGLAAHFSKAKNAPKAEVDYCPVSHVKKPRGAKAGMVIYEGYNTALVKPLSPEKLSD